MVDAQETIARIWNQNIRDQKLRDKYFSFKNKKDVYFVVTARTVGNVKKKKNWRGTYRSNKSCQLCTWKQREKDHQIK